MFGKESSQRRLKTPLTELLLILQEIKHKTTETTKRRHATVILKFPHSTLRVYPAQATPPWYPSNHLATHPGPIHSGVWVIWLNVACLNHTCNISHDILVYYSIRAILKWRWCKSLAFMECSGMSMHQPWWSETPANESQTTSSWTATKIRRDTWCVYIIDLYNMESRYTASITKTKQ